MLKCSGVDSVALENPSVGVQVSLYVNCKPSLLASFLILLIRSSNLHSSKLSKQAAWTKVWKRLLRWLAVQIQICRFSCSTGLVLLRSEVLLSVQLAMLLLWSGNLLVVVCLGPISRI